MPAATLGGIASALFGRVFGGSHNSLIFSLLNTAKNTLIVVSPGKAGYISDS